MNENPELSIITVNYNGIKDTERLIESLLEHLSFSYEIIVVDNGSVENEAALLQKKYPLLKAIRNNRNLGFAGGNNLGIRQATGNYLLFLNNDTIIKDSSIHYLLDIIVQNSNIGGVSPKILFNDGSERIQFAGYTPLSPITIRNCTIGEGALDDGKYDIPSYIPYLHGAAMLVRTSVIEAVGLMPECYFLYYEELDWSTRITKTGYQLFYEPKARVYHDGSSTTGKGSPLKVYFMTRNRLLYASRNRAGVNRLLSIVYQVLVICPKNILVFAMQLKFPLIKACVRGCIDFFSLKKDIRNLYE